MFGLEGNGTMPLFRQTERAWQEQRFDATNWEHQSFLKLIPWLVVLMSSVFSSECNFKSQYTNSIERFFGKWFCLCRENSNFVKIAGKLIYSFRMKIGFCWLSKITLTRNSNWELLILERQYIRSLVGLSPIHSVSMTESNKWGSYSKLKCTSV